MKKLLALSTIPMLALGGLLGAAPANAVGSDLTGFSFTPAILTENGTTDLTVTGGVPGAADFMGCFQLTQDGVVVDSINYSSSAWSLADLSTLSIADLGAINSHIVPNTSTTTEVLYNFNFYNNAPDCLSVSGPADITAGITLEPVADITGVGSADFVEGAAGSVDVTLTPNLGFDFTSAPNAWTLDPSTPLPTGLTFTSTPVSGSADTLTISGTPDVGTTSTGSYNFTLTDSLGNTVTTPVQVNITGGTPATPSASFDSTVYSQENVVSTLTNIAYTNAGFDWTAPGATVALGTGAVLPTGLSLAPAASNLDGSPIIALQGTPTVGQANTYTVPVTITDGNGATATFDLTLIVTAVSTITTNPTSVYNVLGTTVNQSIYFTFGNFDFTGGGSCTVDPTTLPEGLTAEIQTNIGGDPRGVNLIGDPTTLGDYNILITCSDSLGNVGSTTLPFTVAVAEAASFTLNVGALGGLTMMEKVEGSDTVSVVTSPGFDFTTGGGSLTVTGLPAGLSGTVLNENVPGATPSSVILGKPMAPGSSNLTYTLTDSLGHTATQTVQLNVLPASTTESIIMSAQPGQQVGGSTVAYSAEGLTYQSAWTLVVASTPTTIASGTVPLGGSIGGNAQLPATFTAGWHTLTLTAVNYAGATVTKVLSFEVDANGNLIKTSDLAETGDQTLPLLIGGAATLLLAGLATTIAATVNRRKTS